MRVDVSPTHIELRLGNLCNLQCKMCSGMASSQILKNSQKLKKLDPKGYQKYIKREDAYASYDYDWYTNPEWLDNIKEILPTVNILTFTGGEPTLIKEILLIIRTCIELGCAKNISIGTVTNATNINEEFLDLLKEFKRCHIVVSLDGTGEPLEYIRYPAKWSHVRANMVRLMDFVNESPKTRSITINMVMQAFSILHVTDALTEISFMFKTYMNTSAHSSVKIELLMLSFPSYFSISKLPVNVKQLALERITSWLNLNADIVNTWFVHGVFGMLVMLLKEPPVPGISKKLLGYAKFVDQNTSVTLEDNIPELYHLLMEDASSSILS